MLAVELACEAALRKQTKNPATKFLYFCSVFNRENYTEAAGDVNRQ